MCLHIVRPTIFKGGLFLPYDRGRSLAAHLDGYVNNDGNFNDGYVNDGNDVRAVFCHVDDLPLPLLRRLPSTSTSTSASTSASASTSTSKSKTKSKRKSKPVPPRIFSGHLHTPHTSPLSGITFVGSPYQVSLSEAGETKRLIRFDGSWGVLDENVPVPGPRIRRFHRFEGGDFMTRFSDDNDIGIGIGIGSDDIGIDIGSDDIDIDIAKGDVVVVFLPWEGGEGMRADEAFRSRVRSLKGRGVKVIVRDNVKVKVKVKSPQLVKKLVKVDEQEDRDRDRDRAEKAFSFTQTPLEILKEYFEGDIESVQSAQSNSKITQTAEFNLELLRNFTLQAVAVAVASPPPPPQLLQW